MNNNNFNNSYNNSTNNSGYINYNQNYNTQLPSQNNLNNGYIGPNNFFNNIENTPQNNEPVVELPPSKPPINKKKLFIIIGVVLLIIILAITAFIFKDNIIGLFKKSEVVEQNTASYISLKTGEYYQIVTSENKVTWKSSDEKIAIVDNKGMIQAISTGTVTITAMRGEEVVTSYEVNITIDGISNISFEKEKLVMVINNIHRLELLITPNDKTIPNIIWTSSNPSVASVGIDGTVTAISSGTATITATTPAGLKANCEITVSNDSNLLEKIEFETTSKTMYISETYQTNLKITPSSFVGTIKYTSSDPKVATISDQGNIKALAIGTTTITATSNNKTATLNIKVEKIPNKDLKIKFDTNGATSISKTTAECTSKGKGCKITLPSITRNGYKILGWSKTATSTTAEHKVDEEITVYDDVTFYAITSKQIGVRFFSNGTETANVAKTCYLYNNDKSCDITTPPITKTGYDAVGWGTSSTATTATIAPNQTLTITANQNLYAITAKAITVTFNANGAGATRQTKCYLFGNATSCSITAPTLTRTGYTFSGWATTATAKTANHAPNAKITVSSDATFYAVTSKTVSIRYSANKATISKTADTCTMYNQNSYCTVTLPTISRTNYTTVGWGNASGTKLANSGAILNVSNNTTLYALTKIAADGVIEGCGAWLAGSHYYYESASTSATKTSLSSGKAMVIEGVSGEFFKVNIQDVSGSKYVLQKYVLINLPDYIPSMKFQITNASGSYFKSSGYNIPNVTGQKLYSRSTMYSKRTLANQPIAPVNYALAKKLLTAQQNALSKGYTLKVYDSYRPASVSKLVYNNLTSLASTNTTVSNNLKYSYGASGTKYTWGIGWFVSTKVSKHNTGSAVDVSLANKSTGVDLAMPTQVHELSTAAIKYYSPNVSKTSGNYSKEMNDNSKALDSIMTSAGLTPLASEWWHFQDDASHNTILGIASSGLDFQVTTYSAY